MKRSRFISIITIFNLEDALERWKYRSAPPKGKKYPLCFWERDLVELLVWVGAAKWIKANPHVLRDVEPVYHAAGFRVEELRRYQSVLILDYKGTNLYLQPEDLESMLRIYCSK